MDNIIFLQIFTIHCFSTKLQESVCTWNLHSSEVSKGYRNKQIAKYIECQKKKNATEKIKPWRNLQECWEREQFLNMVQRGVPEMMTFEQNMKEVRE